MLYQSLLFCTSILAIGSLIIVAFVIESQKSPSVYGQVQSISHRKFVMRMEPVLLST